jgi:serine/threonine protein kinase
MQQAYNPLQHSIATMSAQQANHPLPPDFQLDRYRIKRQLALGGFSIVYLARDEDGTPVVIKEYLPNSLALRPEGQVVPVITAEHLTAFHHGMKCFFEEGRALAHLNHPNVVRVLNFFRANETVYMVMQYESGIPLQEYIQKHRDDIKEGFVRHVFTRLLNGLRVVHTHKLLHLDIKPANIYLRNDGNPVLLDFGAARQALHSDGPTLKPMYTPGFAAPEQHKTAKTSTTLGPWTDIYAIGASMYACLAIATPLAADKRLENDQLLPAEKRWAGKYSGQLLQTIDWCLALDPKMRPASVFILQKALTEAHLPDQTHSWLDNLMQGVKLFLHK